MLLGCVRPELSALDGPEPAPAVPGRGAEERSWVDMRHATENPSGTSVTWSGAYLLPERGQALQTGCGMQQEEISLHPKPNTALSTQAAGGLGTPGDRTLMQQWQCHESLQQWPKNVSLFRAAGISQGDRVGRTGCGSGVRWPEGRHPCR